MKLTGTYRKLVKGTTINDQTLLSTDYLNHFNELIMMLDMVPDMPDMLYEAEEWAPKTYQDHFRDSSFQHKDLAIWAYENAPDDYRMPLDDCTAKMDAAVISGLPALRKLADLEEFAALNTEAGGLAQQLRSKIDTMSAVINGAMDLRGYESTLTDAKLTLDEREDAPSGSVMGQSDIDALFD